MIEDRIIEIARSFIGLHEIPQNMGWDDKRFESLMEDCGWQKGQAYCAYFCELVWKIAFGELQPELLPDLDRLFSSGAVKTFNNFKEACLFDVNKNPGRGAIVIWQRWKDNLPHWTGHAGIVTTIKNQNEIGTIEANTNVFGHREGDSIEERARLLNMDARNGLVMKGFIHPQLLLK